jgi:hypothetical protein
MSTMLRRSSSRVSRDRSRGQALVEFSLVLIPFVLLLMCVVDLGRGIYTMNATSEAAREIARVTSTHPYTVSGSTKGPLGEHPRTLATIAVQVGLVPGLDIDPATDITCLDITEATIADNACSRDDYIRVHVEAPFSPITPIVAIFGNHVFASDSTMEIH